MTIPTLGSQELNKTFKESRDDLQKINEQITNMKTDISKKMNILKYETEFINQKINAINTGLSIDKTITTFDHTSMGSFNDYGYSVHAKFSKTPIDLFNLKLTSGSSMFRDDIHVSINDIEKDEYRSILMAENNINKTIFFEEMFTDIVTVDVELDRSNILGTTRFNMIEIDPYMYGAYDILNINLFTLDETGEVRKEPDAIISGFNSIGRTRIILPEKKKLQKITIDFKINFKSLKADVEVYPFGLKHIYFYEADFNPSSFVIAELRSDSFIEYLYDEIKLYTTQGTLDTTIDEHQIEAYTDYVGNTLSGRVYPSNDAVKNRIAKNVKKLYIKIPLVTYNKATNKIQEYLCLNGIKFNYQIFDEIIL